MAGSGSGVVENGPNEVIDRLSRGTKGEHEDVSQESCRRSF